MRYASRRRRRRPSYQLRHWWPCSGAGVGGGVNSGSGLWTPTALWGVAKGRYINFLNNNNFCAPPNFMKSDRPLICSRECRSRCNDIMQLFCTTAFHQDRTSGHQWVSFQSFDQLLTLGIFTTEGTKNNNNAPGLSSLAATVLRINLRASWN